MCTYFEFGIKKLNVFVFVTIVVAIELVGSENVQNNVNSTGNEFLEANEGTRSLSRRKRFLVFPDGSSLQLVFCCQTAALIPIGDIFLFGNTAALAWNLPSDPMFLTMFKDDFKPMRRMDTINYVDDHGKIISKVPYTRKTIVNPAFAKRSIDNEEQTYKEKLKIKLDRKKMHERHTKIDYLKSSHLDKNSVEFHRSNRKELYEKLEKLISALPKGDEFEYEEHREYDKAHTETEDCLAKYPGCDPEAMII